MRPIKEEERNIVINVSEIGSESHYEQKEWDLNQLYEMSKQAFGTKDVSQAIRLADKGRETAKKTEEKLWKKKFEELHSEVVGYKLNKAVESNIKRARKEEKIFRYDEALKFFSNAKDGLNEMFKLGKDGPKIEKRMKKIDKEIKEIKEINLKIPEGLLEEESNKEKIENEDDSREIPSEIPQEIPQETEPETSLMTSSIVSLLLLM